MRLAVLLLSAFGLVLAAGAAPAQPAVPNASLEEGTDKPAQWAWRTGEGGQGEFAWETTRAHTGQRSVRLKKIGSVGYVALDSGWIPVTAGKTYRVSAWIYPQQRVRRGVYFMVTQHKDETGPDDLPNTFGTTTTPFVPGVWQEISVNVSVRAGNTGLRIHCIQAFAPSDVVWDDFSVNEAGAEPKSRYEPPTPETVPELATAQPIVARRPRAQARIEMRGARPRLIVDGKSLPWAFHVTWDGDKLEGAHIGDFHQAGVNVHLVPLILGNGLYGRRGPWIGKGQYDFSVVDELLWRVLRSNPNGYIIFYMCCDPYPGWGAENPDDVTWDQKGQKAIVDMHPKRWGNDPQAGERFGPSLVSQKLRADTAETLRRLVAHVEHSAAGKAVIGYHVAGSNDGQWFQWASFDPDNLHLADYSPGAQASFREWLGRRYGHQLAALRAAWHNPTVTFETAAVPPVERLWGDSVFFDPRTQQDVIDYVRFYSEGVQETVDYLAGVIKQATPRPVICGTYYEDITCNSANHIALAGHLASPYLDYLAGPAAYAIRMPGYQGAVRNVFGSTLLHGKTYLTEQDWRSWLSSPDSPENNFAWGRAETGEAHNAMVRRECGMMLAFGLGTWWYDMGGGWFADKQIMGGIAEATRAFTTELPDRDSPRADLAVFVSEESDGCISPRWGGQFRWNGIVNQIEELNTAGVPYRLYLQSDLGKMRLPEHKAYLFLNPYCLTDTQVKAIAALKRDGKLIAFVHAPGLVGAADPAATISALTGIKVTARNEEIDKRATPLQKTHPLLQGLEGEVATAAPLPGPTFAVTDDKAVALARYPGSQAVAVAARDFGVWKSVFIGAPGLGAEFHHNLAAWAGCWIVSDPGDAVYASQHFLTVHAIFPGHKVLRLAAPATVTDLTTGKKLGERMQSVEVDLQRGETRWFRLE